MNIKITENGEDFDGTNYGKNPRPVRPRWHRFRQIAYNDGESMTQQCHKDQTDVNAIVARFDRTGYLPPNTGQGQYGDVTGLQGDLTERISLASQTIQRAEAFAAGYKPPEVVVAATEQPQTTTTAPA